MQINLFTRVYKPAQPCRSTLDRPHALRTCTFVWYSVFCGRHGESQDAKDAQMLVRAFPCKDVFSEWQDIGECTCALWENIFTCAGTHSSAGPCRYPAGQSARPVGFVCVQTYTIRLYWLAAHSYMSCFQTHKQVLTSDHGEGYLENVSIRKIWRSITPTAKEELKDVEMN